MLIIDISQLLTNSTFALNLMNILVKIKYLLWFLLFCFFWNFFYIEYVRMQNITVILIKKSSDMQKQKTKKTFALKTIVAWQYTIIRDLKV